MGAPSACEVAAGAAVSLDVTVTVGGRDDVGVVEVVVGVGVDVGVSLEVVVKGVVEVRSLVVVEDAMVEVEVEVKVEVLFTGLTSRTRGTRETWRTV